MIEVNNLTKFYGDHKAVDNISFSVKDGTVCGFCGPNGAGKSTTMNIMTGCLSATSGTVTIGGHDIFEQPMEAKKLMGYLPEQPPLYLEETPREYLRFIARAKGVPRTELEGEILRVMEETQIDDVADRLIKNLLPAAGRDRPDPSWESQGDYSRRANGRTGPYPGGGDPGSDQEPGETAHGDPE